MISAVNSSKIYKQCVGPVPWFSDTFGTTDRYNRSKILGDHWHKLARFIRLFSLLNSTECKYIQRIENGT